MTVDESSREAGLRPIRELGYARVLDVVESVRGPLRGARALDVGSAHGWFLEALEARGARAVGIEPDVAVASASANRGLDVRSGFFPQDLPGGATFDLITFNDVFEHIPDPGSVLEAVRTRLAPQGVLAMSIPTSTGAVFRGAALSARAGLRGPFRRMWQSDYPSPHLWYFDRSSLGAFLTRHGFAVLAAGSLPSIARAGLRDRIEADPRVGIQARTAFAVAWLAAPALNRPRLSDAMFLVARPARNA